MRPWVNHSSLMTYQWGLRVLRVQELWGLSIGRGVKVAVIDTGVDAQHPDLRSVVHGGIAIREKELEKHFEIDLNGHGTHIAGIIAGTGARGIMGIAPGCQIYAVKAFDERGSAYIGDVVKAVEWCIINRIEIINMSFGVNNPHDELAEVIEHAKQHNIVIVASAGNSGDLALVDYPARYKDVLSVGALTRKGEIASFSKRGSNIDLYAPGSFILSSWPGRTYKHLDGSSMATAYVSGLLALIKSLKRELTICELKRWLNQKNQGHPLDGLRALRALVT